MSGYVGDLSPEQEEALRKVHHMFVSVPLPLLLRETERLWYPPPPPIPQQEMFTLKVTWHAILNLPRSFSLPPAASGSGRHTRQTWRWWLLLPAMAASKEVQSQKSRGDAEKCEEICMCVMPRDFPAADCDQCASGLPCHTHALLYYQNTQFC